MWVMKLEIIENERVRKKRQNGLAANPTDFELFPNRRIAVWKTFRKLKK